MTSMILKPLAAEGTLTANTTVSNSQLVRVINTGATAVLHFGNGTNSNTEYANLTVTNSVSAILVQKAPLDILWGGAALLVVPVAWKA